MTSTSEIPAEILAGVKQVLGKHYEHGPIKLVKMNKGAEQEDRILALTQYRCYVLLYAAKTRVEHKFNHLQIDLLESDKPLKLKFGFPKEKDRDKSLSFLMKSVNDTLDVVEFILKSLQRVFPLTSMDKLIREIRLEPPERQSHMESRLHRMSVVEQGPCGGFSQMYKFMCDYFELPYLAEVAWDVDTIYLSQDCKEMRINDFDDLESKHMLPIIAVLNYNTWFTHLTVVNYKLTHEALKEIPKVVLSSQTLESLTLDGVGLKWDFLQDLSLSLTANSGSNLHSINLSNNPIEDRGIRHLCGPLQKMTHGLVELRLVKTGMTADGASHLGKALGENNFIPTTLKVLDLSGNAFKDAQHGLQNIIGNISRNPKPWADPYTHNLYNFLYQSNNITYLNLADTDCSLNNVFEALHKGCFLSLVHLNLSGTFAHSKHSTAVPRQVKNFFSSARSLKILNMSRNRCPPTLVREILESIGFNKELQRVEIDLSSNELGQEGADAVSSCVSMLNNVTTLNLRDNGFNIAMVSLVAWMGQNHSLECIDLSQNMNTSCKKADREKVVVALEEMIQNPDLPLHTISLANNRFRLETQQLINALGSNTTLLSVDLSGNDMKDIGARLLAKALQINNKLQVVIIDNNNIGVLGFQDLAQAMERNFTLKKMPIPTSDMIASMQKNHEKTEAAIQKIQTCLQRNHSPRKFSNKQAFLLQRGFLYTTAHQMVDKLVVHIEDMVTELTQKSDSELQEKISKARGLIDDANNSKRIYDILQGVVGRSDDEDLTKKLREIACLIESEMETRLEHNANGMVDGTSQLCGYVMQDRRLHEKIEETCREHYKLPPRFVEDLVDQIGAETSNQCSEANLAMASFISDSILDEIIEQLSSVEAELSDELKKFRDEVANGTTVRVVDSIFDESKDEEDEEEEQEEEEEENEGSKEEEGEKEVEKEPVEMKSEDDALIGRTEADDGTIQNGSMDKAKGDDDGGARGGSKGFPQPGPPPMMTKKQNIRVERHKSIKRPVSKFQTEIILKDFEEDSKPQERRSPSPLRGIPNLPDPNKQPSLTEIDSAPKPTAKKNIPKPQKTSVPAVKLGNSDFDVLSNQALTPLRDLRADRPRKQKAASRPYSSRPAPNPNPGDSSHAQNDIGDISQMFESPIIEGFERSEKKSSVSSSPSGSQSNLSEKKSEKKGRFGIGNLFKRNKEDKKESKKDKKEDKKEKKEKETRLKKEKEEMERKEREEKEKKSKKKEKTPVGSSFTSYKSEPVIDDIDRVSKVEPKSPRQDVAPTPEPVQEGSIKDKEGDNVDGHGTPTKPEVSEDADQPVDKPEEPRPVVPKAALRPKTGISMFAPDVMQQMQQRQRSTVKQLNSEDVKESPAAPKSPTIAPKPTSQSSPPTSSKVSPKPLVLPSSPSRVLPSSEKSPAASPLSPKSTSPVPTSPKPALTPPRPSPSPRPTPVPKPRKSELLVGSSVVDVKSSFKESKDEVDATERKASRSDSVKSTSSTSAEKTEADAAEVGNGEQPAVSEGKPEAKPEDTASAKKTIKASGDSPSAEPCEVKQDANDAVVNHTESEDKPQEVLEDKLDDEKHKAPEEKTVSEELAPDKAEEKLQNEPKDADIPLGDEGDSEDINSKVPNTPDGGTKAPSRPGSTSSETSSPVVSSSGSVKNAEKMEPIPAPKRDSTKSPVTSPRNLKDTEKKPEPMPKSDSPPMATKSSSASGGSPNLPSKPKPPISARPPSTRRSVVPPMTEKGIADHRQSLRPVAPRKPEVKERSPHVGLTNSGLKESNGETGDSTPRRPSDIKKGLKSSINGQPPHDITSSENPAKEDGQEPATKNDAIFV